MCQHLHRQPGGVGGEAARGEMVQPHAVAEVQLLDDDRFADLFRVLDHAGHRVADEGLSLANEGLSCRKRKLRSEP